MIMASLEFLNERPFHDVFLTGMELGEDSEAWLRWWRDDFRGAGVSR